MQKKIITIKPRLKEFINNSSVLIRVFEKAYKNI